MNGKYITTMMSIRKYRLVLIPSIITILFCIKCSGQRMLKKDELSTVDLPPKGFGKYTVNIRYVEECELPRRDVKNKEMYNFYVIRHNETHEEMKGKVFKPNTYQVTMMELSPSTIRDGEKKHFYNKTFNNFCNNPLLAPFFKPGYGLGPNCYVEKGNYTIEGVFPNILCHLVFGENFVYERIDLVVVFYSKIGYTFCLRVTIDIRPIPKRKGKIAKSHKKKSEEKQVIKILHSS